MTRRLPRLLVVGAVAALHVIGSVQPVAAHGGDHDGPVTSNYETRITDISPTIDGLNVEVTDVDGTLQISWQGTGEVVVLGYEGEPYLRLTPSGVERNLRSPATYLNEDRYARVDPPASADADAAPEWQPFKPVPVVEWHDHRTHWMSQQRPPQVSSDPGRSHVIFDRWEVRVVVDGRNTVIAGSLTWNPPPSLAVPLATTAAVLAVLTAIMFTRWWRPAAVTFALAGTIAFGVDTAGYVQADNASLANSVWAFNYTVAAALATIRLGMHAIRGTPEPTLAMFGAGIVLAVMGGFDRFDVLTNSQIFSTMPDTVARGAPLVCIATGVALLARFLAFFVPLVIRPNHPDTAEQPAAP